MSDPSLRTVWMHDCIRRMQAGDRTASDELLRAAGERLERLAHRMLRDFPNVRRLADTGDVYQEAVVRLLRSLGQLHPPPASVRDFLGLAATHLRRELLDLARRCGAAKRQGDAPLDIDESGEQQPAVSPRESPDELDCWRRFHEEVDRLPAEEREVIGLRFYHGWAEAEIAELFGVTERTVRRRWTAGCTRLAAALGADMPQP
jgi:RNA polymerase sigma factor (sigma-70 family)